MNKPETWLAPLAFALFGCCTVAATAVAAPPQRPSCPGPLITSQADSERYIRKSEDEWAMSTATNDTSVVKRILAEDFIWVLDGRVLDKKTAVKEAAEGPGSFLSDITDYVHLRFFGTTAVAQGSETWTKTGGRRGRFVWTDTWVNRGGCWQIVNAEDITVDLPPGR